MQVRRLVLRTVLALSLLISAASAGCREPSPVYMSLLTGDPCEPPCWQGLTPGESTEDDVLEFIRTTRIVDTRTIYRGKLSRGGEIVGASIQWRSTAARSRDVQSNEFVIEDGVLKDIIIYPDYDLSLESLLETYGPPDKYHVTITGLHVPSVRVTLFYPTYGFTASLELPVDDARLRPETTVVEVWYLQAAPLERFIELGIGYLGSTPDEWLESLRDWQGYGPVELTYHFGEE